MPPITPTNSKKRASAFTGAGRTLDGDIVISGSNKRAKTATENTQRRPSGISSLDAVDKQSDTGSVRIKASKRQSNFSSGGQSLAGKAVKAKKPQVKKDEEVKLQPKQHDAGGADSRDQDEDADYTPKDAELKADDESDDEFNADRKTGKSLLDLANRYLEAKDDSTEQGPVSTTGLRDGRKRFAYGEGRVLGAGEWACAEDCETSD